MKQKICILLIIISIIMIVSGFYLHVNSPKTLMINSILSQFNSSNITSNEYKSKISTKLSFGFNKTSNLDFTKDIDFNSKKNQLYSDYFLDVINKLSESVFDYYKDDYSYIKFNEVLKKINKISEVKKTNQITNDQIKLLFKYFFESVENKLNYSKFNKTNSEIIVNDMSIKTDKYTISVNSNDLLNIYNEIVKEAKNNSKMDSVYNIIKYYDKDIRNKLNNLKSNNSTKELFSYSIYVLSDGEIISHEINITNKKLQQNFDKINYINCRSNNNQYLELSVQKNNKNVFNLLQKSTSGYNSLTLTSSEIDIYFVGDIIKNDNKTVFNANIFSLKNKNELIGVVNYERNILEKDVKSQINLDIITSYNGNNTNLHSENIIINK